MDQSPHPHVSPYQPEPIKHPRRFHLYHLPLIVGGILLFLLVFFVGRENRNTAQSQTKLHKTSSTSQARTTAPNIILILTDDQRADTLQYMPHVQKLLAQRGVTFTNAHASTPLCCPARAGILSGLYSHTTGVWTNSAPNGGYSAFHITDTLPVWLQKAGYRTGLIGKYLNEYTTTDIPAGWNTWYARMKNTYYGYDLNENGKRVSYGFDPKDYSTDVYTKFAVDFIHGTAGTVPSSKTNKAQNAKTKKEQKKQERQENKNTKKKSLSMAIPEVEAAKMDKQPYFLMVAVDAPHTDGGRSVPRSAKNTAPGDTDAPIVRLKDQRDQTQKEDDDDEVSTDGHDGRKTHVVKDYYAMPAESDRQHCEEITITTNPAYAEPKMNDKSEWLQKIPAWNAQDKERMVRFATSQVCALQAVDRMVKKIVEAVGPDLDNTVIMFASDNGYAWGEHRWSAKNCVYDACTHVPLIISYPRVTTRPSIASSFVELIDIPVTIADLAHAPTPKRLNGLTLVPALTNSEASIRDHAYIELRNNKNRPKGEDYALRNQDYLYVELSTGERELYDLKQDPYELQNLLINKQASLSAAPIIAKFRDILAGEKSH